jgi:hypothetical protein
MGSAACAGGRWCQLGVDGMARVEGEDARFVIEDTLESRFKNSKGYRCIFAHFFTWLGQILNLLYFNMQ